MTSAAMRKSTLSPDETRTFPNGKVEIVHLQDREAAFVTLKPGWKWSTDIRPSAGTEMCQIAHFQYVLSGRLMVEMEAGSRIELRPGDFASIPPGHDAWVVGDESFTAVDFLGMKEYARPRGAQSYSADLDEIVGFD
jgi:mannose-6-phosphate isomerase-like protein (cupin superfamily)